jgi:dihydropteroate synthase
MGILNVTPDSFSDGGEFASIDRALTHAEQMVADGADIIDIGGESTRPGARQIPADEEIARVLAPLRAIVANLDIPISIDTTKPEVARAAIDAGAEIINDISGLRWNTELAAVAAETNAGLILMHSRGEFTTMHSEPPVQDIFDEVVTGLRASVERALECGLASTQIALDVGIGFGKSLEQNLELIAKLDKIVAEFGTYPVAAGTSRKSFIGRILGDVDPSQRLGGSLATALVALENGAKILRVHDVRETAAACRMFSALSQSR